MEGDEINISGNPMIGAVGRNAHVHNSDFNQLWNQTGNNISLPSLADDLAKLQKELLKTAKEPEHYASIAAVTSAENAAKEGNGPNALKHLATASKWVLDVATKIGVSVATEALKKATGF